MKPLTLTVAQLNEYVRKSLAGDPMLRNMCIVGEISNFKRHVSGHLYFTLKDADAAISCAMFRQAATTVRFPPQNGLRVRLFGSVGLYAKTGSYQFYAEHMERDGVGELYMRFEALKQRLAAEGLFDAALKQPLPLLPRGVGVITSATGAVVHDIADVARRRDPGVPLYLCDVSVQGERAPDEIAEAIRLMDSFDKVDVLIVGRGGGSMEDLWAFNEERVARAIFACRKPVVSAVGHETDFSIADFVADLRAPTPSAAAELVVPLRKALQQTLDTMRARLAHAATRAIDERRLRLAGVLNRLGDRSPQRALDNAEARLRACRTLIANAADAGLRQKAHALSGLSTRLRAASPMATVRRGYAIVTLDGAPVRDASSLRAGDALHITLARGGADATVTAINKEECAWRA